MFSTDTKQFRLFQLFEVGLASFVAAQREGMKDVYLKLADKAKEVNMFIPLAFIVGDNQGGDGITGRAANYNQHARRICRSCDATIAQYDSIESDSCLPLNMETIKALVIEQNWEALHKLHQCPSWNPFFEACFGGYIGGIFTAACPSEALHALENGIFLHALKVVLGGGLLPSAACALLDYAIQAWTKLPRQRLMRSTNFEHAPRLLFKDGISTLTKLPAATKVGMMFALVVGGNTRDGRQAFKAISKDQYEDVIHAFEQVLCYWAWLKKDYHWSKNDPVQFETAKEAIAIMLRNLAASVPRTKGRGWNIPKVHEQLHVAHNILLFGSHKNIHTGPAEHNHIELSKKTAKRTQMRKETFDWQVANRLVDKMVVDLALEVMETEDLPDKNIATDSHVSKLPHNSAMFDLHIYPTDIYLNSINVVLAHPKKHGALMPPPHVLQHLVDTCYPLMDRASRPDGVTITCFTELSLNGNIVRAHPVYTVDGPWFDYVAVDVDDNDGEMSSVPARVELMYYFPNNPEERYVVVHPAYDYCQTHTVLTSFHRMQYQDDRPDIFECEEIIDYETDKFILDDDSNTPLPLPRLLTIDSMQVSHHTLMVPYHACSKFMIQVLDQNEWADEFLPSE
jgi:hypothetical protein